MRERRREARRAKMRRRRVAMRGTYTVAQSALREAERLLPSFRGPEGDHEGIIYLLGFAAEEQTVLTTVLAPEADHGPGHVICTPEAITAVQREARRHGLSVLGQLHSHPSEWIEHSRGDDDLVLMPFEGMLSLVCAWYGRVGLEPLSSLGVHQFQNDRWELIDPSSVAERFRVLPAGVDLR